MLAAAVLHFRRSGPFVPHPLHGFVFQWSLSILRQPVVIHNEPESGQALSEAQSGAAA
jgi:hypothetical protein